jgi:hypothetical protein
MVLRIESPSTASLASLDPLDARSLRSEYRSEVIPPALELERAEEVHWLRERKK